jgi:hypothetical protein
MSRMLYKAWIRSFLRVYRTIQLKKGLYIFVPLLCDHRNSFEIVNKTDHNREHFAFAPQIDQL